MTFTRVANDQMKKYGRTQKAAEETIRICINEDVLADYLKEVEVMDIMTALFDEEEVLRRRYLSIERENSEKIARNMLDDGMPVDKIAVYTGLTANEIEKLNNLQLV